MALVKSSSVRWGIILLFMFMGTWLGIFLQQFPATAALFVNVINFTIDVRRIDLIMVEVGFLFALKINLGTLIGAVVGVLITR